MCPPGVRATFSMVRHHLDSLAHGIDEERGEKQRASRRSSPGASSEREPDLSRRRAEPSPAHEEEVDKQARHGVRQDEDVDDALDDLLSGKDRIGART